VHRAVVFLNHRAGQHQRNNWIDTIQQALFRSELTFVPLLESEATTSALEQLRNNEYDTAITIGGDGTIHSIIQQVLGTKARFLVLPGGTANDLSTQLGHNKKLEKSLELVRLDHWTAMDLVNVNGRYMATNGGLGLVGNVAASVERYRNRIPAFLRIMSHLGHRIYSTVLGVKLLKGETAPYRFEIKSKEFSGMIETPVLLVNNQPYLAGSFPVAPQTNNQDGHFNVTIFFHRKLVDLALAIDRVRRHIPPVYDPNIVSFETEEIEIRNLDPQINAAFFGDGEAMGSSTCFNISILPKALRILSDPDLSSLSLPTCSSSNPKESP
jgi:diacylglycerol kinase (ATP)